MSSVFLWSLHELHTFLKPLVLCRDGLSFNAPKAIPIKQPNIVAEGRFSAGLYWSVSFLSLDGNGYCRCVHKWLYVCSPILFLFWYIMTRSCDERAVVFPHMPTSLRVVDCCCDLHSLRRRQRAVKICSRIELHCWSIGLKVSYVPRSSSSEMLLLLVSKCCWLWRLLESALITGLLRWRCVECRPWSSFEVTDFQCIWAEGVLQLEEAGFSACASFQIHSAGFSGTAVQVSTHHSPCMKIKVLSLCPTWVSRWDGLLLLDRTTSARWGYVMRQGKLSEDSCQLVLSFWWWQCSHRR